jgi:large subunit ribosomal protein L6e
LSYPRSFFLTSLGPYNLNGVPLRRVNQAYVIATSSSVDLSGVKVADTFNDAFFAKKAPAKGADGKFIKTDAKVCIPALIRCCPSVSSVAMVHLVPQFVLMVLQTKTVDKARVEATKALYKSLTAAVNKVPHLAQYLKTPFTLSKGQFPHALKF